MRAGELSGNLVQSNVFVRRDQSQDEILMRVELRAAWVAKAARLDIAALALRTAPGTNGGNADRKTGCRLPRRKASLHRLDNANTKINAVGPRHLVPLCSEDN